jgi:citrate synthase
MPSRTAERADMLSAHQAADELGVKLNTLYAYVSRGWLKSYRRRVGREALYRRGDIDALRGLMAAEHGRRGRSLPEASSWVTVAQPSADSATAGVIVAESAVSTIVSGPGGRAGLLYRGFPFEELCERATFEEVCVLLWRGEPHATQEVDLLRAEISGARLPSSVQAALEAVGRDAPPVLRLTAIMPSLAALESHQPRPRIRQAMLIMSVLPLVLSRTNEQPPAGPFNGMAAQLLALARGSASRTQNSQTHQTYQAYEDVQDWEMGALDRVLIACAEHELNASTFAARVVASTGADLYASVLAALCTLSGPIHGGACDRIERMFLQLNTGMRLSACLDQFARERTLPPGFGHAMYPAGDPRAMVLKELATKIAKRKGRRILELAVKVEEQVWKNERLRPNLDFYLTVCTWMLGFERGMPAAIFAVGRTAGWIAHSLEQYGDNRLIRPRMRYRGPAMRHWVGFGREPRA